MRTNLGFKGALVALAFIFLVANIHAQGTSGAGASAPGKIAIINVRNAIVSTAEGRVATAQLTAQFVPKQTSLQSMQKQLEDTQRRLTEGARTLSDDEKMKLQRQGEMISRRLQRDTDEFNEESGAAQNDIVDTIGRKMLDVLDRYARENGYVVVLDTSAQGTPVVYGSSQVDITADIVRLYDQAYPVKSSTPAAAPAPKPATPPPAKKSTQ